MMMTMTINNRSST